MGRAKLIRKAVFVSKDDASVVTFDKVCSGKPRTHHEADVASMSKNSVQQLVPRDAQVVGNFGKNRVQRANLDRRVIGHGKMMLIGVIDRESYVTAGLTSYRITKPTKGLDQTSGIHIARKTHRYSAITSSRTKCKRIILGPLLLSK